MLRNVFKGMEHGDKRLAVQLYYRLWDKNLLTSFKKKQFLEIVDKNDEQDYVTFIGDVVMNYEGSWNIAHERDNHYYYIAPYEVI